MATKSDKVKKATPNVEEPASKKSAVKASSKSKKDEDEDDEEEEEETAPLKKGKAGSKKARTLTTRRKKMRMKRMNGKRAKCRMIGIQILTNLIYPSLLQKKPQEKNLQRMKKMILRSKTILKTLALMTWMEVVDLMMTKIFNLLLKPLVINDMEK